MCEIMAQSTDILEKVIQYESFLNDTLKEDLKYLEIKLKETNEKLKNWYTLKKTVNNVQIHHSKGFKTYIDLGCGIQCRANVSDPSVINVNIGLDVYLKMTLDEAAQYCNMKILVLKKETTHIQEQAIKVKAHIQIVLLGLQELQKV